jgi:hypothetical protein
VTWGLQVLAIQPTKDTFLLSRLSCSVLSVVYQNCIIVAYVRHIFFGRTNFDIQNVASVVFSEIKNEHDKTDEKS